MGGLWATRKRNALLTHEGIYPVVRPGKSWVGNGGKGKAALDYGKET
jgi:hypothetical protein